MSYKRVDIKIKTRDFFDSQNEYHLWITSLSLALQDLITCHKLLFGTNKTEYEVFSFFYYKISIGFLKEALDILQSCLKSSISGNLHRIKGFSKEYSELMDMLEQDPQYNFVRDVINQSRNKIFHYNDFYERPGDKKEIRKILKELYSDNHTSLFSVSNEQRPLNNNYVFADEIQLNHFAKIIERTDNTRTLDSNTVKALTTIMATVVHLLECIVINFVIGIPDSKKYMIKYK